MPRIYPGSTPDKCSDILVQIDNAGRPVYNGSDKSIAGSDAGKICCFRRIIMKKITALLLGLLLLCSAAACAEETLPYLTTEDQDAYYSTTLLTVESYPQVCISPYSSYQLFSRGSTSAHIHYFLNHIGNRDLYVFDFVFLEIFFYFDSLVR